jgi:putative FmdB family regulatory protein
LPYYENKCPKCGHEWESNQSIKDQKKPKCPKCGEEKTERLISKTSFSLKGDWGH